MEPDTKDSGNADQNPGQPDSSLTADVSRILENTRKELEAEFRRRLESAVEEARIAVQRAAEAERQQAVQQEHDRVTAVLQTQFDQTLEQNSSRLRGELEQQLNAATRQWDGERTRLEAEMAVWKAYVDAQREMEESSNQAEILGHFLDRAEAFAPNLAVYVARADGLALWRTRGKGAFPPVISRETMDPEAYFKPIVVRERVVAAICARQPVKSESLEFLAAALARAIESFGVKLQNRVPAAAS